MALFDKEGGLLHGQVGAIVELVKSELREVGGVHDWEAIVQDVAVDFWVCEEEGTEFGLGDCVVDMWCVVVSLKTPQIRSWLVVCLTDGNQWICCGAVWQTVAYCWKREVAVLVQVGRWVWRSAKRDPGEADLVMLSQYCDMGGMATDV